MSELIDRLFTEWQPRVYAKALTMTRNTADAEDITSETFVRIVEKIDQLREVEDPGGWVFSVFKTVFLNWTAKRKNLPCVVGLEEDVTDHAGEENRQEQEDVEGKVATLKSMLPKSLGEYLETAARRESDYSLIALERQISPAYARREMKRVREKLALELKGIRKDLRTLDKALEAYKVDPCNEKADALLSLAATEEAYRWIYSMIVVIEITSAFAVISERLTAFSARVQDEGLSFHDRAKPLLKRMCDQWARARPSQDWLTHLLNMTIVAIFPYLQGEDATIPEKEKLLSELTWFRTPISPDRGRIDYKVLVLLISGLCELIEHDIKVLKDREAAT